MTVNVTYPHLKKKIERIKIAQKWAKLGIIFACAVCLLVNFLVKGPAWSAIVVWSGWTMWWYINSPDLAEFNRISLWSRLVFNATILLGLITWLFSEKAAFGIPLTWFIGQCVAGVLFFTDLRRQKQNMSPMFLLLLAGLIADAVALMVVDVSWKWVFVANIVTSLAVFAGCVVILRGDLFRAFKKTFHIIG